MIYKLLAINIDGTLLQSNGRIHRSTKEAIDYVRDKGVYVTLVTSRSFVSAKKVAKALKLDNYLVTHRGAYIAKDIDKPILAMRIPDDITFEIIRFLEGFPSQIRLIHEKFSMANKQKTNKNLLGKAIITSQDPLFYPQQFVEVISEHLLDEPCSPLEIEAYFDNQKDVTDVKEALQRMFSEVDVIRLSAFQISIVSRGVSKLTSLLYLGKKLNVKTNEMVAIGDSLDDLDMIDQVGLGVAMGNAAEEVKVVADWVTRSNNQHGVAYMVKEHFRKQQPLEFLRKMNIL